MGQRMIVTSSATMTPSITSEITVYNDLKRVDITNRLTKKLTYAKEGVYFAFPFAATKPVIRYEAPDVVMRPDKDMLPGACLNWFTVQHFVEIDAGNLAVCWSTPDAPLVCFQDINRGQWQTTLPMATGHLFAYVMNNYWFTNYLAGQGGDFRFRFSITSRPQSNVVDSVRAGWNASNPLLAVHVKKNPDGPLTKPFAALIQIDQPNVIMIGAKQSEVDSSLALRFWELTGKTTRADVHLPLMPMHKATLTNLVEEPRQAVKIDRTIVHVPVDASGLATVLIE